MKKIIELLTTIILGTLIFGSIIRGADLLPKHPDLPDSAWELYGEGTDFASVLMLDKSNQPDYLTVYLRNHTSSPIQIFSSGPIGFQLFFTDSQGVSHDLHPYTLDYYTRPHSAVVEIVTPGAICSFQIGLSAADAAIMKSYPLQCRFRIINTDTKATYNIVTSPKTYSFPQ
jgi:hypothetical protein